MELKVKDDFDLEVIAESGQCFRFNKAENNTYRIVAFGRVLTIEKIKENTFKLDCSKDDCKKIWYPYFDMDTDYSAIRKKVGDNTFLKECADYSKGMRILRQDKWEMIISFIISQRKSIPAIKTSIERLSKICGDKIDDENHAFPTPIQILSVSPEKLASCGLGYRLDYIIKAAEMFYENPLLVEEMDKLDDEKLFEELKKLQGVGDKVASCVALFGYHRLNFFPKDVWINRALCEHFPDGYDMSLYAPYNGVVQQYIFFAYRSKNK
ncbi:MAG: DNA-3-methyladenine glycosylase 2 family protein [Lachnospiraceae bacterium]|nr:DNA-3-methyladenine glycosylase 2 family protein [Lachnospiraceae bacterium]